MSHFLTMRTGLHGTHQFSPRYAFASLEQAQGAAEHTFASRGAEYLIEDEHGPVPYRLKDGER
jgi:hypothetical protein